MPAMKRKTEATAEVLSKKAKKNQDPKPNVSILRAEEPAFPRGGASILTPLEQKQIQIKAKQDVLFEESTGRKAKGFDSDDEESDGEEVGQNDHEQAKGRQVRHGLAAKGRKQKAIQSLDKPKLKIEGLSYKRLVPGSLVLGQVTQINRHDLALSLPNNLTGYVPLTSMSDKITADVEALISDDSTSDDADQTKDVEDLDLKNYVSVGQYLRAYVVSTSTLPSSGGIGRKHIELSINPKQTNFGLAKTDLIVNNMVQAVVSSVEDHGLVMNLGLDDVNIRGFIGSREISHTKKITDVKEGSVFLCIITGLSSNGNIIKLSIDPQRIGNIKKTSFLTDAPSAGSILPGTAIELLISEVSSIGLVGKFMGVLDMTADFFHSGAATNNKGLEKTFTAGTKVKCRVICTFPAAEDKKLGISFLDHVITFSTHLVSGPTGTLPPTTVLPVSSIIDQAKIIKVQPGLGLFIDIGVDNLRGFAHISQISDNKVEGLDGSTGLYKNGSVHQARVIGYNSIDAIFIMSLEKKIINLPFLRLEDVQTGQVVKGTVSKLIINAAGIGGVLVSICEGISGLVSAMHMADVHLQHPEKKFREGLSVTARVLSVDLERRLMRLTLKRALVHSEAPVWATYDGLLEGMQAPGTLIKILPAGAVVQFYGAVRGFLPVSQMSDSYITDPKQHFRVGQVVSVSIKTVNPIEKRMIVSCRSPSVFDVSQEEAFAAVEAGALVSGIVSEKSAEEIILELTDSGLKGVLPFEHLVDGSPQKALGAGKKIRVGQTLQNLLILSKSESRRWVKLTSKPSLLKASQLGALPETLEAVKPNTELHGFVKNIIPKGVFIEYAGDLTGFLPVSHMPREIRKYHNFGMRKDQSLAANVLSVDRAQARFTLTQQALSTSEGQLTPFKATQMHDRSLSNPVDGISTSLDDFSFGKLTKAKIISIKETQLNVQLADGVHGRIDVSQVFDSWDEIKDRKYPLRIFNPKQVVAVRIIGAHDSRNHRFLPITHSNKAPVFELSAKTKDQNDNELSLLSFDTIQAGSTWVVYVNNFAEDCIWVNLSPNVRGRIRAMEVSDDVSLLSDLAKNFPLGSALRARVLHVDIANNRLDLSARSGPASAPVTIADLTKGMVLPGRVTKVTERYVMVQLSEHISAPIHLVDLADDYEQANPGHYKKNQTIRVCVSDLDIPNKKIILSARPSKILSSSLPVKDLEITSVAQLKVNDVVRGFVKNIAENGVFVSLASNVTGFVRVTDLSDAFIKDWRANFEIDQLVKGKVVAIDPTVHHVQLSLKQSVIDKNYVAPFTYVDMHVGRIVTGKIRKVEDFGVFILVDNSSNVSGLCHRSEIADEKVMDVKKLYDEGDAVKAIVLKVDLEKRRISFGLKASYFSHENGNVESDDEDREGMEGVLLTNQGSREAILEVDEDREAKSDGLDDMESEADTTSSSIELNGGVRMPRDYSPETTQCMSLPASGFDWTGGIQDLGVQDTLSDTDGEAMRKKKKRRKAEIKIDMTGDLDAHGPESVSDFERLLLGQPNSSYLWLRYMAFQLQLNEVAKAREIAERALRTIVHSRDTDSEVLNVWVAYLNLENTYGGDEAVEEVFQRACEHNDAEEMHSRLASIYIQSGKNEKADILLQGMVKKYSQDPKMWLNYATFLFDTIAAPHRARDLLPRAMQSLSKYHHLDLTSKFAQLEFRSSNGDPERGRTIFEGLLSTFPKRLDLWNIMLDLEIKVGIKEQIRRLFGRVTSSKLKPKKAKYFYKKWLEYEEKSGDPQGCETVKARAAEYVRRSEGQKAIVEHGP